MDWIELKTEEQLTDIIKKSFSVSQVIYKHSNACGISSLTKYRLERTVAPTGIDFYFLDIINYRSLSNRISSDLEIRHESPQILVIKNGQCVYEESHLAIRMAKIRAAA